MKIFYYLCLLPLLSVGLCGGEEDLEFATIKLDFRAEFNENPLAIQSEAYDYPTGGDLKIQLFQYYISDLELVPSNGGDPITLSDIDLIRWMSATEDAVENREFNIPPGQYSGIRFGLGVSPDLNAQDPNNFAANFVLNENEFWNANARYVFAKIEANADLNEDGTFDTPLTYHMGSDAVYATISFNEELNLTAFSVTELTVVADILKALSDGSNTFDISNPDQQRVHGGNQAVATDIWNRLAAQFTLELQ